MNEVAYWKVKFFETMCSACFYVIDNKQTAELKECPGCGRKMITNYDFEDEAEESLDG